MEKEVIIFDPKRMLGWFVPLLGICLFFVAGCAECETSADCKSGEVCIDGQCKPAAADGDVDGDVDSDVDTDTDADTDTDTDT
ncbi:MAG: hypothetical protein R6V85_19870, partial [Polyangia bacterium]